MLILWSISLITGRKIWRRFRRVLGFVGGLLGSVSGLGERLSVFSLREKPVGIRVLRLGRKAANLVIELQGGFCEF